jgi:hypothetical protein
MKHAHRLAVLASLASIGAVHCSATRDAAPDQGSGPASGPGSGAGGSTGSAGAGGIGVSSGSGSGGIPECDGSDQKTSSGCDYYAVMPDISFDATGGCYAAFVVNPWDKDVSVQVEYDGQSLDASTFGYVPSGSGPSIQYAPLTNGVIPPGQIAILFLNRFGISPLGLNTDCPAGITPAITSFDAALHGTGIGSAFHISTSIPVVAYDIYPYGGGQGRQLHRGHCLR